MDALETKIKAILAKYTAITADAETGTGGECLEYVQGNLRRDEHSDFPRVSWVEKGGSIEKGRGTSGTNAESPELASFWTDLEVEIWRKDLEETRNCMFNLMAAASLAISEPDLRFTKYEREDDRHENRGVCFLLYMGIRVPAPLNGTRGQLEVTILHHTGTLVDFESTADAVVDVTGDAEEP